MKKFLFVGYNEDFEDTTLTIYEAEDESQVESMIRLDFYGVSSEDEIDGQDWYEDFTNDNPYTIIEIDKIDVKKSVDYKISESKANNNMSNKIGKLNKKNHFIGNKKLKNIKMFFNFLLSEAEDVSFFDVQFGLSHAVEKGLIKDADMDKILDKINTNRIKISDLTKLLSNDELLDIIINKSNNESITEAKKKQIIPTDLKGALLFALETYSSSGLHYTNGEVDKFRDDMYKRFPKNKKDLNYVWDVISDLSNEDSEWDDDSEDYDEWDREKAYKGVEKYIKKIKVK